MHLVHLNYLSLERRGSSVGDNRNTDNTWQMIITYFVSNKMCVSASSCLMNLGAICMFCILLHKGAVSVTLMRDVPCTIRP